MEAYAYFIGWSMGQALVALTGLFFWAIICAPFYRIYRAVRKRKANRHVSATRM